MYQNDQTDGKLEEVVAVVLLTDMKAPRPYLHVSLTLTFMSST